MKKRNKETYFCNSFLPLSSFLASYLSPPKKPKNFRTGWSVTYKKKEESVNGSFAKEAAFQNIAAGLHLYLKEIPSLVSFKDFGKFSSIFIWYIEDWEIKYFIEHLLMLSLMVLKEFLLPTEAVVWTCSVKKVFLKISQNS